MRRGAIRPSTLLRRWREHDPASRYYFLIAFSYLTSAYCRYRAQRVASILAFLQAPPATTAVEDGAFDWRKASWAIEAASAYVPWRSDCLVRAIAATLWLRRHGYAPVFHLGVAQSSEGQVQLKAHAWLSLRDEVIVGGADGDLAAFAAFDSRYGNRKS